MKRKIFIIIITISALLCLGITAAAHPGSTDESGGHVDRKTGEYHYHHGYPAHQHADGICPFDFDDKTDRSYHPDSEIERSTEVIVPEPPAQQINSKLIFRLCLLAVCLAAIVVTAVRNRDELRRTFRPKKKRRKEK